MKKIYIIISLIFFLPLIGCNEVPIDEYLKFEESMYDSNNLAVKEGDLQIKRVIIPSEYDVKTIDTFSSSAFRDNEVIEYVFIPKTIINISVASFKNCINLKEVVFEDGSMAEEIGGNAFENTSLISISIPDSVKIINSGAFSNSTLTTVNINETSNLEIIKTDAFSNTLLETITIPGTVIAIHYGAFAYTHLTSVTFLDGEEELIILGGAFAGIETLREITLPSRVTLPDEGVFGGCHNLTIHINECNGIDDWAERFNMIEYGVYAEVINDCLVD